MFADGQRLVVRRAGDGAVDVGKASAIFFVPRPDLRRHIFVVGHVVLPDVLWREFYERAAPSTTASPVGHWPRWRMGSAEKQRTPKRGFGVLRNLKRRRLF